MILRGLILMFFCAAIAQAQTRLVKFGRFTTDDGLSNHRVFAVAQDSTGFLWVATALGLDRLDGHRVRHFYHNPRDTTSVPSGAMTALLVTRNGTVWAGTSEGAVARYRADQDFFVTVAGLEARVNCLVEDSNGGLWVATRGEGLAYFAPDSSMQPGIPDRSWFNPPVFFRRNPTDTTGIQDDDVNTIVEDKDGVLWIGTNGGLDRFENKTGSFIHNPNISDPVTALSFDEDGGLWVGTSRGLLKADENGRPVLRITHNARDSQSLTGDEITSLEAGAGQFLWIGTKQGLNRLNRQSGKVTRLIHNPANPFSVSHDLIFSLNTDRSGTLWIPTESGISKLTATSEQFGYSLYGETPPRPQDVTAVHVSTVDGTLWIGTWGNGLVAVRDDVSKNYRHDSRNAKSISIDNIFTVFEDSRGWIWVGTDRGVDRYRVEDDSFERHAWDVKGDFCSIVSIAEDTEGRLWFGTTTYGIIILDPVRGASRRLAHDEGDPTSLPGERINALLADDMGAMWIGTTGAGLIRYDASSKSFGYFHDSQGTSSRGPGNTIFMLARDQSAQVWIAGASGLHRYDPVRKEMQLVVLDSLREIIPVQMVSDNQNRIWVSTFQDGIFLISKEGVPLLHFGENDGLQSNAFTHAACRTKDGMMIFGGENGYNVFDPADILVDRKQPGVVLTDFRVFNKPLRASVPVWELTEVTLPYNENYFSVEFSALDHAAPERVVYAFLLESLDKTWTHAPNDPFAAYQAVPPGDYVLRVRASNGFGSGNNGEVAVRIVVTPPFWQTAWFNALVALLAIGTLVSVYNYLTYQIRRLEGIRQQIADDLHDDIGPRLSTIRGRIELFRKNLRNDDEHQHLSVASQVTIQAADALRNVVWFLNPDHDRADDIVSKMKGAAVMLLAGIAHTFEEENKRSLPIMDMEFRRNLILLYQEVLNNIVKHSRATKVTIALRIDDRAIDLRISDNGAGFDLGEKKDGHGLGSLRHRAGQMQGVVAVESTPGSGTTVSFKATLPRLPLVVRFKSAVMKRFTHRTTVSLKP